MPVAFTCNHVSAPFLLNILFNLSQCVPSLVGNFYVVHVHYEAVNTLVLHKCTGIICFLNDIMVMWEHLAI